MQFTTIGIIHTVLFVVNVFQLVLSLYASVWLKSERIIAARSKAIEYIFWCTCILMSIKDYFLTLDAMTAEDNFEVPCVTRIWFNYLVRMRCINDTHHYQVAIFTFIVIMKCLRLYFIFNFTKRRLVVSSDTKKKSWWEKLQDDPRIFSERGLLTTIGCVISFTILFPSLIWVVGEVNVLNVCSQNC